jgi:predicted lactoylglutathione lyase
MNASVPAGTEMARPFLPAKDFDLSKRFYQALGFTIVLDNHQVAIFRIGRIR